MQLIGVQAAEQIAEWKEKYGDVFEARLHDGVAYFKKADRNIMRAAWSFLTKDRIKYCEIVIENCWLGGDERFKQNDGWFLSLIDWVSMLTTFEEVEIKKL